MGPQKLVGGLNEFSRIDRTDLPDGSVLAVNHYVYMKALEAAVVV
jgi:hypothetical protein